MPPPVSRPIVHCDSGRLTVSTAEGWIYTEAGSSAGGAAGVGAAALPVERNALFRRALRRLAAFRWMIPRFAALSTAEIRLRTVFSSFSPGAPAILFCILRRRVRTLRLRRERFVVWRERFAADLVLAMSGKA